MAENAPNFHNMAIQSSLFKGRSDWYFCFLKSEKIAQVLAVLAVLSGSSEGKLSELAELANHIPKTMAHFAAGEVAAEQVLADFFSLVSAIRVAHVEGSVGKENGLVLIREYEQLIEKFAASMHPSPFATADDFRVPNIEVPHPAQGLFAPRKDSNSPVAVPIKDKNAHKGHLGVTQTSSDRSEKILQYVRQNERVSIKDIANTIRNCSEKTIQRELGVLIQKGLIEKLGERRWSVYRAL